MVGREYIAAADSRSAKCKEGTTVHQIQENTEIANQIHHFYLRFVDLTSTFIFMVKNGRHFISFERTGEPVGYKSPAGSKRPFF